MFQQGEDAMLIRVKLVDRDTLIWGIIWTLLLTLSVKGFGSEKNTGYESRPVILMEKDLAQSLGYVSALMGKYKNILAVPQGIYSFAEISHMAHDFNRCGGGMEMSPEEMVMVFKNLEKIEKQNITYTNAGLFLQPRLSRSLVVAQAVSEVKVNKLKNIVTTLSNFPTRSARQKSPNTHVGWLEDYLQEMVSVASFPVYIDRVDHVRTKQQTLKVTIPGAERPDEIVILGGHLDSISRGRIAPGADDNASGSSNLVEALRILLGYGQPERTIEFYWYAAEELGLWGSKEVAKSYRKAQKDVIGVLQLDMTLFAGAGEFIYASMGDFTSAWLRDILVHINEEYIGGTLLKGRCGYACSDHASWYNQGYPTLNPFEANMSKMNRRIHTSKDTVGSRLNFEHSAMFSKIAVAFAMILGNSDMREPKFVRLQNF